MRRDVPKEKYNLRRKLARDTLIKWGVPKKLIGKIISSSHKLGDLEKIIQATEKRKPKDPGKYFLRGLNHYRQKHGKSPLYRSLTTDRKGRERIMKKRKQFE